MKESMQVFVIMLVFWSIVVIPLWLVAWAILSYMDRRVKDGPRCRKCGYDLRASSGESCPECGKTLAPRGVWPVGLPRRGPAIHRIAIWVWFSVIATVGLTNFYAHYLRANLWEHEHYNQSLVLLSEPSSGAYDFAVIDLNGNDWKSAGDQSDGRIKPSQFTIEIQTADLAQQAVTVNLKTGQASPHLMPNQAYDHINFPAFDATINRSVVTPEVLAAFHPIGDDSTIDAAILVEMQIVIQAANHLGENSTLPMDPDAVQAEIKRFADANPEVWDSFGVFRILPARFSAAEVEPLPAWPAWIILGGGFLITLFGIILIRKRTYNRMAVDAIPETASPTTTISPQ